MAENIFQKYREALPGFVNIYAFFKWHKTLIIFWWALSILYIHVVLTQQHLTHFVNDTVWLLVINELIN